MSTRHRNLASLLSPLTSLAIFIPGDRHYPTGAPFRSFVPEDEDNFINLNWIEFNGEGVGYQP